MKDQEKEDEEEFDEYEYETESELEVDDEDQIQNTDDGEMVATSSTQNEDEYDPSEQYDDEEDEHEEDEEFIYGHDSDDEFTDALDYDVRDDPWWDDMLPKTQQKFLFMQRHKNPEAWPDQIIPHAAKTSNFDYATISYVSHTLICTLYIT